MQLQDRSPFEIKCDLSAVSKSLRFVKLFDYYSSATKNVFERVAEQKHPLSYDEYACFVKETESLKLTIEAAVELLAKDVFIKIDDKRIERVNALLENSVRAANALFRVCIQICNEKNQTEPFAQRTPVARKCWRRLQLYSKVSSSMHAQTFQQLRAECGE